MGVGFVIALTGGIGSGKSTVAAMFERLGAAIVDTDAIAHALTQPGGRAVPVIAEHFGPSFITDAGALDREAMRNRVFAEPKARSLLEACLHPMIRTEVEESLERAFAPDRYTLLVVPLLFESVAYRNRAHRILAVDCPTALQISRVGQRSGLSQAEAGRIMSAQVTRACRLQMADDVICNAGEPRMLDGQVTRLHTQFRRLMRDVCLREATPDRDASADL